jgi:hypothetical protein
VNRWLAVIREHKAEIIDVLKVGAGGGDAMSALSNLIREKSDTGNSAATALRCVAASVCETFCKFAEGINPDCPLAIFREFGAS